MTQIQTVECYDTKENRLATKILIALLTIVGNMCWS